MLTSRTIGEEKHSKPAAVTKIVDFDGTIFFTEGCVSEASKDITGRRLTREEVYSLPSTQRCEIFSWSDKKYAGLAVPNEQMLEILKDGADEHEIIVLTARTVDSAKKTLWLLEKCNAPFDLLMVRRNDRKTELPKEKDGEWKAEIMKVVKRSCQSIEFYEDRIENIVRVKQQLGEDGISYFLVSREGIKRV